MANIDAAFVQYIPQTLAIVLGGVVGFLYVLDSWEGSDKETKLMEKPRVKNALWVIGACAVGFIGDINNLSAAGNRAILYLCFLLAAILSASITILIQRQAIVSQLDNHRKANPETYPDPEYDLPSDYLWWGKRYEQQRYDEAVAKRKEQQIEKYRRWFTVFIPQYQRCLTVGMGSIAAYFRSPQNEEELARAILDRICIVTQFYFQKGKEELSITANCMIVRNVNDLTNEQKEQLRYWAGTNSTHERALCTRVFSNDSKIRHDTLPVENRENKGRSLPGAPLAYLNDRDEVIDDTGGIDYAQIALDGTIIKKLKEWFEQTHFKSFASLVLHEPSTGTPFGVLNIEANGKNIFGASDEAKHGIGNLVRPLQTALEYIIDYPGKQHKI